MSPRRTRRRPAAALSTIALLAVAACGADGSAGEPSAAGPTADAFPVTLEHAFGETTVPDEPQRVVTWGWGSTDAAIALGIVPVAMPTQSYGGDAEGVLPWVREALEERGEDVPTLLPDVQEAPVEAIAAADPDLILAPYSGITEKEYDLLSAIAPTVAYPEAAWSTPWRETIEIVGAALGKDDEAAELLAGIDAEVADAGAGHPELAGRSVAMVWPTPDAFYVYRPADSRVAFTEDLGLTSDPTVTALAEGDSTFYYTLSTERLADLDSDVLVVYADSEEQLDSFLESPEARLMEQVERGSVAAVVGTELIAAVSPPTALSLTWGLDEYAAELAEAAAAAG